jgi:hypothetical protein
MPYRYSHNQDLLFLLGQMRWLNVSWRYRSTSERSLFSVLYEVFAATAGVAAKMWPHVEMYWLPFPG